LDAQAVGSTKPDDREKAANLCSNRSKMDNKTMFYADQMTKFYEKYPRDRDLPIAYLIQMLIGPQPKTIDEIHEWVNRNK
jgi:hypothetical protein